MNNTQRIDVPQNSVPHTPIITSDNEFAGHQVTHGEHSDTVFLLNPDESGTGQWSLAINDVDDLAEVWEHKSTIDTDVDLQARIESLSDAMGYDVPSITTNSDGCGCGCGGSKKTDETPSFDIDELMESGSGDDESDETETDADKYDWENDSIRRRKGSVNPMEL